ncbi:Stk1 family PASTA domain-containing Ser/Thr kinase [Paenactinomyces guangxiensis]|nr:Stk1 family PASTA domain-containing Ser/Thr kinase [Paenactinomyces guangxiensis]
MEGKKLGGRYEIVNRVGGGGMAVVYKAKDLLLNRYVAIKVLSESLSNDSEFIRRFSREAQAAASLSHPNVVNVYDVGRDGYTHYIVMELVEGPTLKQYIQERGPLPVEEAANIAVQICDGLAHAHENQIVHRDIKPHNILLGASGRAKVTDFGIARAASSSTITQTGSVMGSVHYFSPEQARGGVIGEKSDIYSLGIVFYEMLTGQLPFDGDSAISIALKHLQEPVEDPRNLNPDIPDNVAQIILRALDKDPAMRYTSARAMMQDISYAVQIDRRTEPGWANHRQTPKQDFYQTIPLSVDEETENNPVATAVETPSRFQSPTQRPEIRSGRKETPQRTSTPIGDQTMMNLERLRNMPNDQDKTIFQRTVIWLDNVQAKMPLWQKILFGFITVVVIITLSVMGFNFFWDVISGGDSDQEAVANGNEKQVPMKLFTNVDDAKQWLKDHGFPEPEVIEKGHEGAKPGELWDQQPKAGEKVVPQNTKVKLFVGKDGVTVMKYAGEWEDNIPKKGPGYDIKILYCNTGKKHGQAYAQSPKDGETIEKGGTVKVWVHINKNFCREAPPSS